MALLRQLVACAAVALLSLSAQAQTYPTRPIHFIVPTGAGGLADTAARVVGDKLQQRMGQPIVVENKPGAGGLLGGEFVAKARPDGYTVLVATSAYPLLAHTNRSSMRFDVLRADRDLSDRRSPVLPQLQTAAEAGLSGVTAPSWIGFMTPGGTPPEVNARLQRELSAILKSPEITEQFRKLGAETVGDSSEQFGRTIASEYNTWERVIRQAKLKFE